MIVDTSALVAIVAGEEGREPLRTALAQEPNVIPAPVLVEFALVTSLEGSEPNPDAQAFITTLLSACSRIGAFAEEDAQYAAEAHERYGRGNGKGGRLNILDVMVYLLARRLRLPILCTGRDFAATDVPVHSASRPW